MCVCERNGIKQVGANRVVGQGEREGFCELCNSYVPAG